MARSLGSNLGVTIASATYQYTLKASLWSRFGDEPHAAEEIDRIRNNLEELIHLPQGWRPGVMASFAEAFYRVWLIMLAAAVCAAVCSSFIKQYELHSTLDRR